MDPSNSSTANEPVQQEQSFPLIAMVQLFTFSAALVTCIDFNACAKRIEETFTSSRASVTSFAILVLSATALSGFLIGVAIGLGQIRKWRGMFLCGFIGTVASLLVMAAYLAPASPAQAAAAMLVPLVTTIVLRIKTH